MLTFRWRHMHLLLEGPVGSSHCNFLPDVRCLSLVSLFHPTLAPITGNPQPHAAGSAVGPYSKYPVNIFTGPPPSGWTQFWTNIHGLGSGA